MTAGFLFEAQNPYFRWKHKFSADVENDTSNENLTPEMFVVSDVSDILYLIILLKVLRQ